MRQGFLSGVRLTVVTITALALVACGGHRPPEQQPAPPPAPADLLLEPTSGPTVVHPGDLISIEFWRQPELSGERVVDRNGRIQLPLLRDIEIVGLTPEEIRIKLTEEYSAFYSDPLIVVNVRLGVNVTGSVGTPGRYTVDPAFTLFDVLGLAGGLRSDAKRKHIQLIREGQKYEISLEAALLSQKARNLRLQSGDWIYVPSRFWTLRRIATYATFGVLVLQIVTLVSVI